jgi:hypothetical protein
VFTTYVLPPTRFHAAMIGALALSIGLVFYFVVAMDRPFARSGTRASLELVAKRELHGTPLIDRCVLAEQR